MRTASRIPALRAWPRIASCICGVALVIRCGLAICAGPAADGKAVQNSPAELLYRYLDPQGRTVYANRPPAAGVQTRVLPYSPSPPRRPASPATPRAPLAEGAPPARPQPPAAPGPGQQQVLVEQLARQIEALQAARNALKEGEAVRNGDERNYQRYLDRVQGLRDTVIRHEGIVEALQAQLRLLGGGGLVE